MNTKLKEIVKEKYTEIATSSANAGCGCCCGPQPIEINMIGDEYKNIDGHIPDADLALGCGIPTEYADIKPGDTVLDLGSGAGNDVFIASKIAGEAGFVIGVDMVPQMIERANLNKEKLGFRNVDFRLGEIESMPVEDASVNVVISNCVLNLVPDKTAAFAEIYRTLKPGGHFCISDVVIEGDIPPGFQKSAEMYAGCVSGAVSQGEYLGLISKAGFKNIDVVKQKRIDLPGELYDRHLTHEEKVTLMNNNFGIFSITVKGVK